MNYTIAIGILAAIFLCGCFLYVRRKRIERSSMNSDLDIPNFLRSDNAGNNTVGNSDFDPEIRIHPWGRLNNAAEPIFYRSPATLPVCHNGSLIY